MQYLKKRGKKSIAVGESMIGIYAVFKKKEKKKSIAVGESVIGV